MLTILIIALGSGAEYAVFFVCRKFAPADIAIFAPILIAVLLFVISEIG